MKRPHEPAPGECCGSGCTRCVWDIYYDELAKFENYIAKGGVEKERSESSEDDEPVNYVGSVVVKYLTVSEAFTRTSLHSTEEWERREMKARDLVRVEKVELIKSSATVFSPEAPGISVLDVHASYPMLNALPGDAVEVLVPNSAGTNEADDVERLCRALHLDPRTWCELHRSPFVPENNFPPWLPLEEPLSVCQLLSFYVDITSSSYLLHRSFFQGLLRIYNNAKVAAKSTDTADASPDPELVQLLEDCASTNKGPELLRAVSKSESPLCYPCLVDVLEVFSFVNVPLERLLEVSGPLQPRKFSVANYRPSYSSATTPMQLCVREVCVARSRNLKTSSVVGKPRRLAGMLNEAAHRTAVEHSNYFLGHTSYPLCSTARATACRSTAPLRKMYIGFDLFGSSSFAQQLQAACSSACDPRRPHHLRCPVLLVGCGTGIAPLIAAVSQLMSCRTLAACDEPPYPCWVFYGARNRAELVYDDTLKAALAAGAIGRYECSVSRVVGTGGHGTRVVDLLKGHVDVVSGALQGAGQMFACGPAGALRSIRKFLMCDLLAEAEDDDSVQEQRILLLEEKGKLNFDTWSTGNIFE